MKKKSRSKKVVKSSCKCSCLPSWLDTIIKWFCRFYLFGSKDKAKTVVKKKSAEKGILNKLDELIFIVILLVGLVLPFVVFQLWWWAIMMSIIAATVGITELVSKLVTGKTISQQFWKWSIAQDAAGHYINKWKAWVVIGGLQVAWACLLIHLAAKMIK